MSTDLVPGKYQLTESENFDKFMGALGVGYLVRKLGNQSKPLVTIRGRRLEHEVRESRQDD